MLASTLLVVALAAAPADAALTLGPEALARDRLVVVGRDVIVEGRALADVVAIQGSVRVSGEVGGDVIVLGGDAILGPAALVRGNAYVLGGRLEVASGARIDGQAISYPGVSAAWLTLIEGPSLGLPPTSPVVLGAKLGLLFAWTLLAVLLFAVSGNAVLGTSRGVLDEPFRNFFVGLTAVLTLTLTALFLASFAPGLLAVPLLALAILFALVLKLWGMVALFHALGETLGRRLLGRRVAPLQAMTLGLALLGAIRLLPWVGTWAWTVASLIAVGAALTTKLGRREPWLEPALRPLPDLRV